MKKFRSFLDPKADLVFKKIFCEHSNLLQSFLNSVLPLSEDQKIVSLEYLPSEQFPDVPALKYSIVDVKCQDRDGRIFIVEMQMIWGDCFDKRLLFGAAHAYVNQLKRGDHYNQLKTVYSLGIVNEIFDKTSDEWCHHYRLMHAHSPEKQLDGIELVFIELPKFNFKAPKNHLDREGTLWLRFLKEFDETAREVPEEFLKNQNVNIALELAEASNFTNLELASYEKFWDVMRVNTSFAQSYERGIEHGREEGREEGKQEGAHKKALEMAQKLFAMGLTEPQICEATGLPLAEITALKKSGKRGPL